MGSLPLRMKEILAGQNTIIRPSSESLSLLQQMHQQGGLLVTLQASAVCPCLRAFATAVLFCPKQQIPTRFIPLVLPRPRKGLYSAPSWFDFLCIVLILLIFFVASLPLPGCFSFEESNSMVAIWFLIHR